MYQYKNFSRIYWNTKKLISRLKTRNHKRAALSRPIRKLQFEVMFATAAYRRGKTEALAFKLSLLHKKLLEKCHSERQLKFKTWLSKLNKLGYCRATRSFYSELSSRSNIPDNVIRPIRNEKGTLSTSLAECLNYWQAYYKKLYKRSEKPASLHPLKGGKHRLLGEAEQVI